MKICFVGFEVLTVVSTKMAVFWVMAPCSLVEVYRFIALMMEAARTSETSVNFYQTTWRHNPEDSHLRIHRRENLKSYSGDINSILDLYSRRHDFPHPCDGLQNNHLFLKRPLADTVFDMSDVDHILIFTFFLNRRREDNIF
jgi:hypothetical protein